MNTKQQFKPAKLHRRIFALLYDSLLTFAVLMFAMLIPTLAGTNYLELEKQSMHSCLYPNLIVATLPLKHSPDNLRTSLCMNSFLSIQAATTLNNKNPFLLIYLLLVLYLFPAWFWVHGGQTLGMRAWKIRLETTQRKNPGWRIAFYRWLAAWVSFASFGLGYLWMLFDPERQTLHDRISKTRVIQVDKNYIPELNR